MDKRLLQYLKKEKKLFAILNIKREEPNIITDKFVDTFFVTYQQVFLDVFFDFLKMNGNLKDTLEKELVMQGGIYQRTDYIPKVLACSLAWQRTKQGHNFSKNFTNHTLKPTISFDNSKISLKFPAVLKQPY